MKTDWKRWIALVLASGALLLATLACGASTETTPGSPVEGEATVAPQESGGEIVVDSFTLFRDDGFGEPGEEVSSFLPGDRIQHFEATTAEFLPSGSVVKWVFTAVDTTEGQDIPITEVETNVALANSLTAYLELENDFPTGTYRADLFVDGVLVDSFDYSVQE